VVVDLEAAVADEDVAFGETNRCPAAAPLPGRERRHAAAVHPGP
jgi:hypothetical protein